jgi:hypothetical protein
MIVTVQGIQKTCDHVKHVGKLKHGTTGSGTVRSL